MRRAGEVGATRRVTAVALALALVSGVLSISPPPVGAAPPGSLEMPRRAPGRIPRLESSLQDDLGASRAGRVGSSGADLVTVVVEGADPNATRRAVERVDGTITTEAGGLVQADVPRAALADLATSDGVRLVREPRRAVADSLSEGVASTGAQAWQDDGWTGTGSTVAVIDAGFLGYESRLGNELPGGAEADLDRCEEPGATAHGTAVAEVVHDAAPTAGLRLICIDTDVEFIDALDTLPDDVQIVNGSISFTLTGRGDGTGPLDAAVARARARGVLYVASAGNFGATHFHTNAAGDSPGEVNNDAVNISPDDRLSFTVPPDTIAHIAVQWDGWPTTKQDFDVFLLSGDTLIDSSTFDQSSGAGGKPVEYVQTDLLAGEAMGYTIVVNRYSGTATPRIDFYFDGVTSVEHTTPSSVVEPASSPAALAVGAYCVHSGAAEGYTSTGPTIDGRIKPDLSAPDGTSGSIYGTSSGCGGPDGFFGTSASAPHVAGAAALLLGASPDLDVAQLQQVLVARAQDAGTPGRDNVYGAGRLRLGTAGDAEVANPRPFTPRAPVRLYDTRAGLVGAVEAPDRTTPLGPGGRVKVPVAGVAGVPADAIAVVLNVTAVSPTAAGYVTVHPGGTLPKASNLNFVANQTIAVHVTATVGTDHQIELFNASGNTHLVVDLTGWYGPTGSAGGATDLLHTLPAPARAFDTRPGLEGYGEAAGGDVTSPVGPGQSVPVAVAGAGGVPANATAIVMNVTAVQPTATTYIAAYAAGSPAPNTSALNLTAGQVVANLVILPVGDDGVVRFLNHAGRTNLVVDTIGWYAPGVGGAGYVALAPPTRVLDTRSGTGLRRGPLDAGGTHEIRVAHYDGVPATAQAVMLGVVAVAPSVAGYLTVYPGSQPVPGSSNVNFSKGSTTPNAVLAGVGTDGTVAVRNSAGSTHVVSDLFGYFLDPAMVPIALADPPPPPPPQPGRIDLSEWHPPPGVVPASGTALYIEGDVGEPYTGGHSSLHTLANSNMSGGAGNRRIGVWVDEGKAPLWRIELLEPPLVDSPLPPPPPVEGDFSSSDGALILIQPNPPDVCPFNQGVVRFIVDDITFEGGVATSFSVRFQVACTAGDQNVGALLRGFARVETGDATVPPPPPPASSFAWQPPAGSTPASGPYLYLKSSPGDWIGRGVTQLIKPPSTFDVTDGYANFLFVTTKIEAFSNGLDFRFGGPRSNTGISTGFYEHTDENPALGRFSFDGDGRGCSLYRASVAIDEIAYDIDGDLVLLTARFVQYCDSSAAPLYGKLHWVHP